MPLSTEQSDTAPMHTNISGGNQSHIPRDYTLVPPDALAQVARCLYDGRRKYGKDNWRLIPSEDHINHAINHVYLHLAGNTREDHLVHAATRMFMALEMSTLEGVDNDSEP
jgi:Domain of unknown function (DUF5664)